MTDRRSDHEALEFTDLEPAEAEPSKKPSADPSEVEELPGGAETVSGGSDAPPAEAEVRAADGPVPLRELDKAPRHLRTAAVVVVAGSLFPWMAHGGGLLTAVAAKAVVLAGVAVLYLYWKHRGGEEVPAPFGPLAELSLAPRKKDEGKKKRRRRDATPDSAAVLRGASFPSALHLLSLAVVVAGVCLPLAEPATDFGQAAAELGMLAWGAATWVHIYAYERGGKFNPIFPLMFLGHALAGILGAIGGFGGGTEGLLQAVGGLVVGLGGVVAAYTIIEALKQAKTEGDAKKAAAAEARRAARRGRS